MRRVNYYNTKAKKSFLEVKKLVLASKTDRRKMLILLTYLSSFALIALLAGIVFVFIVLAIFSHDLPNPNRLLTRSDELSTKLLDRTGQPIYEVYGDKNRSLVELKDISPNLSHATLAVEDSNFYLHKGISIPGMIRAFLNTITGQGLQGGSTLTQQVVKNALLTQDRTITRKMKEFVLALQLENRYTKDEILQMYLNETPYGGQSYGALTASKAYFNKNPSELSIAEAAFLAGLPQSPTKYSPYSSDPSVGLERKNYVLYLMKERGWTDNDGKRHYLGEEDYQTALKADLRFEPAAVSFKAPHFVFYVKEELAKRYGEEFVEQAGLQVTTTLDLKLQESLQTIVKEEVDKAASLHIGNGALVAVDPQTGQVLAMVGSKDYFAPSEPEGCISGITGENSCTFEPNLNVTVARRQPGSSIKPITYATMLSEGYTAAYPLLDVPTTFVGADGGRDYTPENYDGKFRGPVSLRKALGNSLNIPAVKAVQIVGVDQMIKMAQKLGITTFENPQRYGPAITLGGGETKLLEMTDAFATFGNGGIYREPNPILEVKDAESKVLYNWRDTGGERAVSEEVAFLISDILSDDGARSDVFGAGSLLHISGQDVAVKTGTTDDKRDNYALGFTKEMAVGVWVGNNNNDAMFQVASGVSGASPIWRRAMVEALKDKKPNDFVAPKTVKKIEVDGLTGMLPFKDHKTKTEWFIEGTEPTSVSDWYQTLEVCDADGKIANDACKDADDTEVKNYIGIQAEIPAWQMDVDAWISENFKGENEYFPPMMKSELKYDGDEAEENEPAVKIVGVKDGDPVPRKFRLKVEVSTVRDIERVKVYLDGKEVTDDESYPYGYNFSFAPGEVGSHEFKATAEDDEGDKGDDSIHLNVF